MKRILSFVLLAAMLAVMAVSVSAAPTFASAKPTNLGTLILEKGPTGNEMTEKGGTFSNLKDTGNTSFCNKKDSWARYEFTVEKAGTYTFVIEYIARTGKNRFVDYAIDDKSKSVLVDLEESNDKRWAVITADLTAGKHNFYIMAPTGFDDNAVKSCDVYGWSLYLTKEAAATKADPSNAPATSDTLLIAVAALAVSATAAIVITKKH